MNGDGSFGVARGEQGGAEVIEVTAVTGRKQAIASDKGSTAPVRGLSLLQVGQPWWVRMHQKVVPLLLYASSNST